MRVCRWCKGDLRRASRGDLICVQCGREWRSAYEEWRIGYEAKLDRGLTVGAFETARQKAMSRAARLLRRGKTLESVARVTGLSHADVIRARQYAGAVVQKPLL